MEYFQDQNESSVNDNIISSENNGFIIGYLVLLALTAFCGTFGNILVIGAVLVHQKLRILSNIFIVNLAIADLMVSAIINPFSILGALTEGEFFYKYPALCETIACLCIVSCMCSIWNIAAISINRYICICHRLLYYDMYTKEKMPFYIFGLWLLCFGIDFPNFVGWGGHEFNTEGYLCVFNFLTGYNYTLYLTFLGICTPMTLVSFCYFRILIFARSVRKELTKIGKMDNDKKIKQTDLRLLRSIATIWVVFILMWAPFTAFVLFFYGTWPKWVFKMAVALAHTNSSINCIIYAATNKHFREGYVKFLLLCLPLKKQSSSTLSSLNIAINTENP
ncbi:melatonin receptor type 1A-like [Amphiura filiformis]|uniref:melatonin receptor type 1A-like n=1 Tax=Amphiura filiformis TaxID=82378 RepID=UPI003B2134BF